MSCFKTVALLSLASVTLLIFLIRPLQAQNSPSISRILTLEGKSQILVAGSTEWKPASTQDILRPGDQFRTLHNSRATIRLSDLSRVRLNQLTTLQILLPKDAVKKSLLDLKSGSIYFFSREKPKELEFQTPFTIGAIRGTEFFLGSNESTGTLLTLLDGNVDLSPNNSQPFSMESSQSVLIPPDTSQTGVPDISPSPLASIQWVLHYPTTLDLQDLQLPPEEQKRYRSSLNFYAQGNLLRALEVFPDVLSELNSPVPGFISPSKSARLYYANLLLAVGQLETARPILESLLPEFPLAAAPLKLIAAIQFQTSNLLESPNSASQWLAQSYYLQAHHNLSAALEAAQQAVLRSPRFSYAWTRLAELHFSFADFERMQQALDTSLSLAPQSPTTQTLLGFIAAQNQKNDQALQHFSQALNISPSLPTAWLGKGLILYRMGKSQEGQEHLQTAATLDPQQALLRSYFGKILSDQNQPLLAEKEFRLAKSLDLNDPTPWLYTALHQQKYNQPNSAITNLLHAQSLNQNRALFRSKMLLDQDHAVQSANLAQIYSEAGLVLYGLQEASHATQVDYSNPAAHLFLSQSYQTLEDPYRYNLRYQTPRVQQWLLANLLAPPGSGSLSQIISQQEYSRLLQADGPHLRSMTSYQSQGDWSQQASQYGTFGNTSYALEGDYQSRNGFRPNQDNEERTLSFQVKHRITPQDDILLQAFTYESTRGDVALYSNPADASRTLEVEESQEPIVLLGYRHQWSPNHHTLVLASRIQDTLRIREPNAKSLFLHQVNQQPVNLRVDPFFQLDQRNTLTVYSAELQHIYQSNNHTLLIGSRFLSGEVDSRSDFDRPSSSPPLLLHHHSESDLQRSSLYAHSLWTPLESLTFHVGVNYEVLTHPENLDLPPTSPGTQSHIQISPQMGFTYTPWSGARLRAVYAHTLGGYSLDQTLRLDPTQVAGFLTSPRSLIPESVAGLVPAPTFHTAGLAWDQRFRSQTFLGLQTEYRTSQAKRSVGTTVNSHPFLPIPDLSSSLRQRLKYEENSITAYLHQLVGTAWALGGSYQFVHADLHSRYLGIPLSVPQVESKTRSDLHHSQISVSYTHPSGWYAQSQTHHYHQKNHQSFDETFFQQDITCGIRFWKRQANMALGILNLTDEDYRLHPIHSTLSPPRKRTLAVKLILDF